jgi:VWFA-related protein
MRARRLARFTPTLLAAAVVSLSLAAVPPRSRAQDPFAASSAFGEAIDVRVVNVEAVVTDRSGERVRGLQPGDFELLVDGVPLPIDYFTEVVEGEATAAAPAAPGAPQPQVTGGRVGRSFLVFVDESFALATQRNQVLERLERELPRLAPEDRMAVVAFDGRHLDLLSAWTADRAALAATLERARRRPARGNEVLATRRSLHRENALIALAEEDFAAGASSGTRAGSAQERTGGGSGGLRAGAAQERGERWLDLPARTEGVIAAAAAALRGLPAGEGRKVMLLLSGGLPFVADDELLNRDPTGTAGHNVHLTRGNDLFRPLSDTANLLGYTLYPVDVTGVDALSDNIDAEAARPAVVPAAFVTSAWERETHDALFFLAGETGGRALLNSARLDALPRVARDTGSYYWLGFTPQWQADDRRHALEVRVARPGLTVRTRSGFSDLSRWSEAAFETESVLLFGGRPADRRLRVEAGETRREGWSMIRVPVTVVLPSESITVLAADKKFRAEATLSLGAIDKWGGRSTLPQVPLQLTLAERPRPGSFVRHVVNLRLRRVEQRVVFAVHDELSGAMLWGELDVAP